MVTHPDHAHGSGVSVWELLLVAVPMSAGLGRDGLPRLDVGDQVALTLTCSQRERGVLIVAA
jgi:hypothetical protein